MAAPERPGGITALAVFFTVGSAISATAVVSLLSPGGVLEPMWRINPRGREAFERMGALGVVLLLLVSLSCAAAARGLWSMKRWGHRLAVALIAVNLAGDVLNAAFGDWRAVFGVPIAAAISAYLLARRTRARFAPPPAPVAD